MTQNTSSTTYNLSVFRAIPLSIKVLISEIHLKIITGLRRWEIKELKKRLDREYLTLGKLYYNLDEKDEEQKKEIELAKNQIEFLEKEIKSLEKQIEQLREKIIKDRIENL